MKKLENFESITFLNLTIPEKIAKINSIIDNFPEERKKHICFECRKQIGDFKTYNPHRRMIVDVANK